MIDQLRTLVEAESPSQEVQALQACADVLSELSAAVVGAAFERVIVDGRPHLRLAFGEPKVALIGHFDTVWPLGTIDRWPFEINGGVATGPGVFDMKAGIIQALHAVAALPSPDGVELLFTSDEETGSATSRGLVEETAKRVGACLVLEPAADGKIKIARKGTSMYRFIVEGRAAHAGLEPEKGANALCELAHLVLAMDAIARPDLGTTVTPTVAQAGTATNVVPARAVLDIDGRAELPDEQVRVDDEIRAITATIEGCRLVLEGGINRPPLHESMALALYERALAAAAAVGIDPPGSIAVGGGSDGNFTAGVGTPTLDGLGAVGAGAHAEGEHIEVAEMRPRTELLTALIADLLANPLA